MNKKDLLHHICEALDIVNAKYDMIVPNSRELVAVSAMVLLTASNGYVGTSISLLFIVIRLIHLRGYWGKWSGKLHEKEKEKVQDDINC